MEGRIEAAPNDIENQYIQLETSMMAELDCLPPVSPSRCIYRVPDGLRHVCEEAYTPRIISIGPLHHGKEALRAMEEHKKRYLQYFLGRLTNNLRLKDYIKIVKDQEDKLRSYYSETIELKSDEFVRVVLVDAIFIIEFLFRFWYPKLLDENDYIFGKPRKSVDVWFDLHMLENQLPFFILEKLFDPDIFTVPSEYSDRHNGVERLSLLFLSHYFLNDGPTFGGMLHNLETINSSQVLHFVDLLRKLIIDSTLEEQSVAQSKHTTTPSIEELHLAGVKFKVGSTKNLFDIQFKNGILKIPKLKTEDGTELILRNLVAFEQCAFITQKRKKTESAFECYISDYVCIMDQFVDTSKDVELLVQYKIVENILGGGDDALSTMINSVSTGVIYHPTDLAYDTLRIDLNKFCGSGCNKNMANLRQNYFNTPWATISFFAAVILLILTIVQTICSIISLS